MLKRDPSYFELFFRCFVFFAIGSCPQDKFVNELCFALFLQITLNPLEPDFLKIFCFDESPFCGVTGSLYFGLRLTLPMDRNHHDIYGHHGMENTAKETTT